MRPARQTSPTAAPRGKGSVATFHARVAGVGLITTVVVLAAACLTFFLQQWAVARTQSHETHSELTRVTAATAAVILSQDSAHRLAGLFSPAALGEDTVSAKLLDAQGREAASYRRSTGAQAPTEVITAPVTLAGRPVGQVAMTFETPELGAMLPKFMALTFMLLFGGVGVALFLARSLAGRVIAPVRQLSEAMNDVAGGGGFRHVEITAADPLFQSLTDSFNHLQTKLGEREQDLRDAMYELQVARDAAEEANVLKTQFLANMSHEIRTPLNGVLAMAEVMAMGDMDSIQRERLEIIRQSGGLLLSVLNDVLDLSKIEAGKMTLVIDNFDLEATLKTVRDSYATLATGKGLDFNVEVTDAAKGWWRGDADRLRQITGNLLSNAVKFTSAGSVSVLADVSSEGLCFTVRDTGVGIPSEKLATLFEKFTQADNTATRRFGGTGLGLAICREFVQMMGGAITVESQEGQGSVFTVRLPLARGEPASDAPRAEIKTDSEFSLRLLAAEDNVTNQQVLAAVMSSLGIDLDIVEDGKATVETWRKGAYDLILMDIQMPVMDGITAAREIRAIEAAESRRRTPIVALTANALVHQIEEYLAAGMDGHVAKPIEIAKLYQAISDALVSAASAPPARAPAAKSA
jgi:two-component system, sensor histidine kinase